jgi:hypothetical protein
MPRRPMLLASGGTLWNRGDTVRNASVHVNEAPIWIGFLVAVIALSAMVAWLIYEEIRWGDDSPVGLGKEIPRREKAEQSRGDDRGES